MAALFAVSCAEPLFAFRSGPPAAVDGSPGALSASCRGCHGSAEGPGFAQILNFPAQYQANVTYNLIVRITDASRAGAGFQASVQTSSGVPAGTITQTDLSNTQLTSRSSPTVWRGVQHTGAGVNNAVLNWVAMGNAAEYAFDWTAPASDMGPLTVWAAGNAINNNFSSSGDFIYLTTATATFLPPVTGACCDEAHGMCDDGQVQSDCESAGGRYGGDNSTCATISPECVPIPGACCDQATGDCMDNVEFIHCHDATWGGPGSTCATLDPACTALPGACCDDVTGQCVNGVLSADCTSRWGGPGSTCSTITPACVPAVGACCDGTDGSCTNGLTLAICTGEQLTWTMATACMDLNPPCTEHTGACCDRLAGECFDDVPGSACVGTHAVWSKGEACADVVCDTATGACCDHDAFGVCQEGVTLAQCECATCEWLKGGTCQQLVCDHAAIPTVSEWGLLVLTLLMLIAAKVTFDRSPAASLLRG